MKTKKPSSSSPFPGTLEVRKSSGDYGIVFVVSRRHLEHIQPLFEKEGQVFVVSPRPVQDMEQAEDIIKQDAQDVGAALCGRPEEGNHAGLPLPVTVAAMADAFKISERRVQQLEKEGVFVKTGHDRYDALKSAAGWVRDREARAKSSTLNQQREENLMKKNRELDRLHAVEMGKLVLAADVQHAREQENANIRQKFLYLKALAPQLEGRTVNEIEKRLDEYGRKSLGELDRSDTEMRGQGEGATEQQEQGVSPQGTQRKSKPRKSKTRQRRSDVKKK